MKTRRREFLRLVTGAVASFGGAVLPAGSFAAPTGVTAGDVAASGPSSPSRVAVIRGSDLSKMAREALAALGGAKRFVEHGQTVFLKPNLVTAQNAGRKPITRNGECTKPEIVIAVAEECLQAGAKEVIIGEGAQAPRFSWEQIKTVEGSSSIADEVARLNGRYRGQVKLACLNSDSPDWVDVPSRTALKNIAVSSLAARADVVISLPVIKTHRGAGMSLSMKNFFGVVSSQRHGGYPFRNGLHVAGLDQCIVDLAAALKPRLTIIDGSYCCEGDGPVVAPMMGLGQTVDMKQRLGSWVLLASTDLVAADSTAARLTSQDVKALGHVMLAHEQGLGEVREEHITLDGDKLDRLKVDWRPARRVDVLQNS